MKLRTCFASSLVLLSIGAYAQTFDTFEGGRSSETAWRAAAGGPLALEDFESYTNHQLMTAIPSLRLTLDSNQVDGYPSIYADPSQHMNGPLNLGNFNSATFAGQFADMIMQVEPGYRMTAFGFWNTDPQGVYVVRAYDANDNLLGTISAQTFWTGVSFAGFVSSVPVAKLVFEGSMGDGWNHIDDVQNRVFAQDSAFVNGVITLGEFAIDPAGTAVDFEMIQGGQVVETQTVVLGAGGTYSLATGATGVTGMTAKASHWLKQAKPPGTLPPGATVTVNFSLTNGDCDGDNEVAIGDYALLSNAYNSFLGDPNWDARCDLNGDEGVDIGDYAILSSHYGEFGD